MNTFLKNAILVSAVVMLPALYAADQQPIQNKKPSEIAAEEWDKSLISGTISGVVCGASTRKAHVMVSNQLPFHIQAWVQGLNLCKVVSKNHEEPVFDVYLWDSEIVKSGGEAAVCYVARHTVAYNSSQVFLGDVDKISAREVNLVKPKLFWQSIDKTYKGVVDLDDVYKKSYDMKVVLKADSAPKVSYEKQWFGDTSERTEVAKEQLGLLIEAKMAKGDHVLAVTLQNYYREYYS